MWTGQILVRAQIPTSPSSTKLTQAQNQSKMQPPRSQQE
jgi:hypothetical protein